MKVIVIKNATETAFVEIVTDLPCCPPDWGLKNANFTVMAVRGRSAEEVAAGILFKEVAFDVTIGAQYSISYFKDWCEANNFAMDLQGGGITDVAVSVGSLPEASISCCPPGWGLHVGLGQIERVVVVAAANTAHALAGKFFLLNTYIACPPPVGAICHDLYYVWFNSGGSTKDPIFTAQAEERVLLEGRVGVEVLIENNDTSSQVASKIATVVGALENFSASGGSTARIESVIKYDHNTSMVVNVNGAFANSATTQKGRADGGVYHWTPVVNGLSATSQKRWRISEGALPAGLELNSGTGEVSDPYLVDVTLVVDAIEYSEPWDTDLDTTTTNFVTTHAAALALVGVDITAFGGTLTITLDDPTTPIDIDWKVSPTSVIGLTSGTIDLTGTSGTANVNIAGVNYLATFDTDLDTTMTNFVATHAAALEALGIFLEFPGQRMVFSQMVPPYPPVPIAVVPVSGNLAGFPGFDMYSQKVTTDFTLEVTDSIGGIATLETSIDVFVSN